MARRKPSTQPTGIIDVVKDIVSPWLGAPPAQNKQVTQAQGLARAAAETLDQTFAGGLVKAGVQGNKALVKQVAVNAAALGAGYIAGKAAVTAAGAVKGIVRDSSQVYYGIHGSPTSGLSKITPQIGKNTQGFNKNVTGMFGSNSAVTSPKVFSYKPEPTNVAATTQYAQDAGRGTGSVYVVKTKAKNVSSNIVDTSKAASFTDSFAAQSLSREQMSSKAMKVVKEFPVSNYTKKTYNEMEGGWETTQDFGPLSQQIKDAIQSNKKFKFANLTKLPKKR